MPVEDQAEILRLWITGEPAKTFVLERLSERMNAGTLLMIAALAAAISGAAGGVSALVFVGIILTLEKAMTVYHSNHFIKEYIPKDRCIEILTREPHAQQPVGVAAEPKPEEILSASWNSQVKTEVP